MYSDHPPLLVMPDTDDGHYEARMKFPDLHVGFCHEWKVCPDPRTCGNRNAAGWRPANWCLRCLAGYPAMHLDEKDLDSPRIGDHRG